MNTQLYNKTKRKIGIDLDDTLLDFIGALILYNKKVYGINLKREQFKSFLFSEAWGRTPEEAKDRVFNFYKTKYFRNMQPIPGSIEAINILARENGLLVITSRPDDVREETSMQVKKNFQDNFLDTFYSYNHYTKMGSNRRTKPEICLDFGISLIIDDSLEYAIQCAEVGIRVLLFGDYPWNQNGNLPPNILRIKNWEKALEKLI